MNLFIVGNGFDLAHFLPTKYENFHTYLKNTYPGALQTDLSFDISSITHPDGSEIFEANEVVAFIIDIISEAETNGDKWCDLENSLGKLDFEKYFDEMSYLYDEADDDFNEFHRAYDYEDVSSNFHDVIIKVKDLFAEWINSIKISDVKAKQTFKEILDTSNDYCINFNYTRVLEDIYGAKNVFHLHGQQNSEIIIGHGINQNEDSRYIGTEDALWEIHHALKKDTSKVIEHWKSLFDSLNLVDKIYSHGFSFSDVDLPYIKRVCETVNTESVTWFLNDFEESIIREEYMNRIRRCGYRGAFSAFSL
ncbi:MULTISPECIES: bacteriophage abortive infection AbiH family protein [unclassified Exiguobacterium]|uniref:bacteriophage abortive infection AbiH family protein n=1 Tax=unclassified Exiguobacterium TaxID=2644629 RepID=UPI0008B3454B|nr:MULTISPECIES: bacteriophage abortive infection AbiH family protein [unclassified Exiguobacterium]OGX77775.1 hypothetical protein A6395_15550 [Exiguobacterium sp. SH31]TCI59056.1 hypothetical protein EVJ21_14055 [Exiguobacterium sp. SH0S2]